MALVSVQRVEFITGRLLEYLLEFGKDLHGITSSIVFKNLMIALSDQYHLVAPYYPKFGLVR